MQQSERKSSRTRSPRGRSPSGRTSRWPCKDYLKGTCTTPFCEKWHPSECVFYKTKSGCRFGEKCSYAHRQVDEQPSKRSEKNGDKSVVVMLKITRQLGCVFQDMEPPKSTTILRKSPNTLKPIRCVQFTKAVLCHADIRDQNPSLGMIFPGDPHQCNPTAPKFEDRSQEETEWQEQGARGAAWKLAKHIQQLKEKHKTAFSSPTENWCLPAPSNLRKESLLQTPERRCTWPTTVITANGEVQTHEETTVYVKELDIFLIMKVLEDTPAVLSLGKLCWWTRIFLWVDQRSKTTSHWKRYSDTVKFGKLRTDRGSWFINEFFFKLAFFNIHDTFKAGNWSSQVFLKLVYLTIHDIFNCVKRTCGETRTVRPVRDGSPSRNRVKWTCGEPRTGRPVLFWNFRRVVDQTNQKPKTK